MVNSAWMISSTCGHVVPLKNIAYNSDAIYVYIRQHTHLRLWFHVMMMFAYSQAVLVHMIRDA